MARVVYLDLTLFAELDRDALGLLSADLQVY